MEKKSCLTPNKTKRSVLIVKIRVTIPPIVKKVVHTYYWKEKNTDGKTVMLQLHW